MQFVLFDGKARESLLPLTFTRAVSDLLIGIDTLGQKWDYYLDTKTQISTRDYLQAGYALVLDDTPLVCIDPSYIANQFLADRARSLEVGQALFWQDQIIMQCVDKKDFTNFHESKLLPKAQHTINIESEARILKINYPYDLFINNDEVLKMDFIRYTKNKTSSNPDASNKIIGEQFFAEENVDLSGAIINTTTGPVYIKQNAQIMEGAMIRGGLALGACSTIKMGAKLYGAISIGDHCKIGGEVTNSVFHSFTNKGHDGYLGNSVIGSWCNFGADTNSSNLKNNYKNIDAYNYASGKFESTGLLFLGLIMGDHSKTGINTMLNTGTVVGVHSNIFGSGFPPKHIPSYSWGGQNDLTLYRLDKAIEVAQSVMARRGMELSDQDINVFTYLYHQIADR